MIVAALGGERYLIIHTLLDSRLISIYITVRVTFYLLSSLCCCAVIAVSNSKLGGTGGG